MSRRNNFDRLIRGEGAEIAQAQIGEAVAEVEARRDRIVAEAQGRDPRDLAADAIAAAEKQPQTPTMDDLFRGRRSKRTKVGPLHADTDNQDGPLPVTSFDGGARTTSRQPDSPSMTSLLRADAMGRAADREGLARDLDHQHRN